MTGSAMTKPAPPNLRLTAATVPPVADRGRLLLPAEVAREIFHEKIGPRWILENAPSALRVRLGRRVCFRANDMIAWRDGLGAG